MVLLCLVSMNAAIAKMWNPLLDQEKIGQRLLTAWIAKESLRTLLALARTGSCRAGSRRCPAPAPRAVALR